MHRTMDTSQRIFLGLTRNPAPLVGPVTPDRLSRILTRLMAVRKQYHFWPGEGGLDAWDVDRLIELSQSLPVKKVDISSIGEVDTVYWFSDDTDPPTVRSVVDHARLIEDGISDGSSPKRLGGERARSMAR
jgi:hypothetical protein